MQRVAAVIDARHQAPGRGTRRTIVPPRTGAHATFRPRTNDEAVSAADLRRDPSSKASPARFHLPEEEHTQARHHVHNRAERDHTAHRLDPVTSSRRRTTALPPPPVAPPAPLSLA